MLDDAITQPEGISFADFFFLLRRQRVLIAATTVGAILLAVLQLHLATYRYTVTMQLAPVSDSVSGDGNLGALRALTGVNAARDDGAQSFSLFQAGLRSRPAAEALASDEALLKRLYPDEWSEQEGHWREPPSTFRPVLNFIRTLLGFKVTSWKPPDAGRLLEFLQTSVSITPNRTNPLVAVEMLHDDPELAKQFLLRLNTIVDRVMRERALRRADGYIAYITGQLQRVTVSDYRAALITNLAEQEKDRMMASADLSFVSEVFSGPVVSERPTSPIPFVVLMFGAIAGLAVGTMLALIREGGQWKARTR